MLNNKLNNDFILIEEEINNASFLKSKGLSNEVAYYVYHYEPTLEKNIRRGIDDIVLKYSRKDKKIEILHIDLYEEMINYIIERNLLDMCYELEMEFGYDYLHNSISNLLRMDLESSFFVNLIKEKTKNIENKYVVFISGIGKAYPIVRTHHILNNLHLNFDNAPVIFFYPGKYTGQNFKLFNTINDENYYRAFSLNSILKLKEEEYEN